MKTKSIRAVNGTAKSRWLREYQRARNAHQHGAVAVGAALAAMPLRFYPTDRRYACTGLFLPSYSGSSAEIHAILEEQRQGHICTWRNSFLKNSLFRIIDRARFRVTLAVGF